MRPVLLPHEGWIQQDGLSAVSHDGRSHLNLMTVSLAAGVDLDGVAAVAESQLANLRASLPELTVGDRDVRVLRPGREAILHPVMFVQGEVRYEGLAAVWAEAGAVVAALASGEAGALSTAAALDLLADVEPDRWRIGVALSEDELVAAAGLVGVAPPPLTAVSLDESRSDDVRAAVLSSARSSLWARGLIGPSSSPGEEADELVVDGGLAAVLRIVADAEHALFVTVRAPGSALTHLIARRSDDAALLSPSGPGTVTLRRISWSAAESALRALCGLDHSEDGRSGSELDGVETATEALRAAADGSGTPPLDMIRWSVTVRGLRRRSGTTEGLDLAWIDAGTDGVHRVDSEGVATSRLAAVPLTEVESGLRDSLGLGA